METPPPEPSGAPREDRSARGVSLGVVTGLVASVFIGPFVWMVSNGSATFGVSAVLIVVVLSGLVLLGWWRWYQRTSGEMALGFAFGMVIALLLGGTCTGWMVYGM